MNLIQKKSLFFAILTLLPLLGVIFYSTSYFSYFLVLLGIILLVIWKSYFGVALLLRKSVTENAKFLILPTLFNFGLAFLLITFFDINFKYLFLFIGFVANFYIYQALKRVQNLQDKASIFYRNVLISTSFVSVLFSVAAIFRFYVSFSISDVRVPLSLVVLLVTLIFYLVSYFLSWQNGVDIKKFQPYLLVTALLAAEITLVSLVWIINYPVYTVFEKGNLGGIPFPAVLLTIVFYFIWGVFSHKIDKTLTREVIIEYVLFSILFLSVLFITAKWLPVM